MNDDPKTCPECDGTVEAMDACHTWPRGDMWMSCMGCFSAILYFCNNCGWKFVHGLNKSNPLNVENEQNRPPWIVGDPMIDKFGDTLLEDGVAWYLDD